MKLKFDIHYKDMGEEENRSLEMMLQCPLRDTVRARSLGDLETLEGMG